MKRSYELIFKIKLLKYYVKVIAESNLFDKYFIPDLPIQQLRGSIT